MKEKIRKWFQSTGAVLKSIAFSMQISWEASKIISIVRMLLILVSAFVPLVRVWLAKELIAVLTESIGGENSGYFIRKFVTYCLIMLGVQVVLRVSNVLQEITGEIQKDAIHKSIDCTVMRKVAELDISYYDSKDFYHQLNIAKRDASCLPDLVWCTADAIKQGINIVGSFLVIASLHWIFPILVILVCIPGFKANADYQLFYYRYGCITSTKELKCTYIFNLFKDKMFAKEMKLYETKDYFLKKYEELWKECYAGRKEIIMKFGKRSALADLLPEICEIGVQFLAAIKVLVGKGTLADYTYYLGMLSNAISNMNGLLDSVAQILNMNTRITNYKEFLALENTLEPCGDRVISDVPEIEFCNVSFRYPNTQKDILKNISFKIKPGEKIAFVGLNGAGKTTLTKLIMRFYEPTKGKILLNGIDIHEYAERDIQAMFASVFQDYAQFSLVVQECIGLSEVERIEDLDKIKEACEKSGADQFIEKWEQGYHTYLTKRFEKNGEELSGGQWQKIALASAFFKNSKVLILDEPTSSLDPIAEYEIFDKFTNLSVGKSTVLISHRLSSVTMVDTIYVIDDGIVAESGSHEELMRNNGAYSRLFKLQAEKYVANM